MRLGLHDEIDRYPAMTVVDGLRREDMRTRRPSTVKV